MRDIPAPTSSLRSAVRPERVIHDLRALAARTSGPDGAERVAWTDTWRDARAFAVERAAGAGVVSEVDRTGNLWFLPARPADRLVVVGSHLDSVPAGGWLDGALGVFAGIEVVRAMADVDDPARHAVAVVDWADEEGARFGRSLYGSSGFVGTLDVAHLAMLIDNDGLSASDVLALNGVNVAALHGPDPRLGRLVAYLELHIEQGSVLERTGAALAAVTGTVGIERDRLAFHGQSAHAGPTPMAGRHDAFLTAAEVALDLERLAREADGRATTGRLDLAPGVPTAVAGDAVLYTDLRHADAAALAHLRARALATAQARAAARGVTVERERVWAIEPRAFDAGLVELATAAAASATPAVSNPLPSGALHDAAELAALVPTAMIFCRSIAGLSHCAEEDTHEDDLHAAVRALAELVRVTVTR